MKRVVAAVIERPDRRILIGQRRREDTSPLKWEFPGGKVREGESPEAALDREILEELRIRVVQRVAIGSVRHRYAQSDDELSVVFYAARPDSYDITPQVFEQVAWALPKELGSYDFLTANQAIVAELATGRIKPMEILEMEKASSQNEKGQSRSTTP